MNRIGSSKRRNGPRASAAMLLWGVMATGCVFDPDAKCGDDLVESKDGFTCGCPKGMIFTPQGCIKCAKNEVATAFSCDCKPGFSRSGAGAACTKTPEPMESTDPPSGDGGTTEPETDEAPSCTDSSDCEGDAECRVSSGECVPRPTGLKTACTSAADCAGFEASFCNVGYSNVCEVNKCDLANNNCFPGFHCCNYNTPPFNIAEPLCVEEMFPCP